MKNIKFEEAIERLDEIVKSLESGKADLDTSLSLFEEGIEIVKHCNKCLENAEQRVRILTANENGEIIDSAFVGSGDEA